MTIPYPLGRPRRSDSVHMGIVVLNDALAANRDLVRHVRDEAECQPFLAILERERIELENARSALQALAAHQGAVAA